MRSIKELELNQPKNQKLSQVLVIITHKKFPYTTATRAIKVPR